MPFSIVRDEIARQSADIVVVPADPSLHVALERARDLLETDGETEIRIVVPGAAATKNRRKLFPELEQFIDDAYAEDLLRRAGLALSPASKADLIVEWFILRGDYDIFAINEALYAYDQPILG